MHALRHPWLRRAAAAPARRTLQVICNVATGPRPTAANKAVQINMLDEGFDGAWYWDLEQRAGCSQAAWWAI